MPDWNLQATWDAAYDVFIDSDGTRGGYSHAMYTYTRETWQKRLAAISQGLPNLSFGDNILIVGGAFGYLAEEIIIGQGFPTSKLFIADNSTYIHNNKTNSIYCNPSIEPLILDIDITDPNAANLFKAAGAGNPQGKFSWIITEQVLSSIPVGDLPTFYQSCNDLLAGGQSAILHVVVDLPDTVPPTLPPNNDPPFNDFRWQTLQQWHDEATLLGFGSHYFLSESSIWSPNPRILGGA